MMTIFMLYFRKTISLISQYGVLCSVIILIVITVLSLTPVAEEPSRNGFDKILHLLAYMALSFPSALSYHPKTNPVFFFAVLWGGCIECIQPYFGREADILDATFNTFGAYAGIVLAKFFSSLLYTIPSPSDE